MRRTRTSFAALALAATMLVSSVSSSITALADTVTNQTANETTETVTVLSEQDAPALLVTEIATDVVSSDGTKLDFLEVYNNSNETIDFTDYSAFYVSTNGTYREFSKDALTSGGNGTYEADFGGKEELMIEPGKTLVIGFAKTESTDAEKTTTENLVKSFNEYYGTELTAYDNFIRFNAGYLYTASQKGFFIGKSWDNIVAKAWMNKEGDDIATNTGDKLAIQYAYSGNGKECEKTEVGTATPGTVDAAQVPATKVAMPESKELTVEKTAATQNANGDLELTAEVPYTGSASNLTVKVSYRQIVAGAFEQEYYDYNEVEMTPSGDGKTFTTVVEGNQLFGDSLEWTVSANYGEKAEDGTVVMAKTEEQSASINDTSSDAADSCPLIITEIGLAPKFVSGVSTGTGRRQQFCFIEVYNQSDKAVSATYLKAHYKQFHDNYANDNSVCDITVSNSDYTCMIQPGEVMVYWVSCNYDYTTLDMFNQYYGTNLETGKNILDFSGYTWYGTGYKPSYGSEYMRAFDVNNYGEINLGYNKTLPVTGAKMNYSQDAKINGSNTAFQYTYPRNGSDQSILVEVSKPTPGVVEDWQIPEQAKDCSAFEYTGTPAPTSSDYTPTLKECEIGDLQTPETLDEGKDLKVMYDTDFLFSTNSISQARLDAFQVDDNEEHCGGTTQLLNSPYVLYYEMWYKLDNDSDWTVVKERKNWRPGHYPAQISADTLFGYDQVTYKVRSYTLYGYAETEEKTVYINRTNDTEGTVRLNVQDDEIISGTTTLTANDGEENINTKILVDGEEVETTKMLENGAYFSINTNAVYGYYKNAITAASEDSEREIIGNMNLWCEEPNNKLIHVDNKFFAYNKETDSYDVTLSVWAGNSGTPFEDMYSYAADGRQSYKVNSLQLKLANGNTYNPTSVGGIEVGDDYDPATWYDVNGTVMHLDVCFSIPASEVNAVGYALDTKTLEDGEHEITARAAKKVTTAKVVVDNTAPKINLTVDEVQYDEIALSVDTIVTDANDIEELEISLDGQEIKVPATVVPSELSVGAHKLIIAATDVAGNITTKAYDFETEEVTPEVSEVESEEVDGIKADLTVNVGKSRSDVTYYEGRSLTKEAGDIIYGDIVTGEKGDFTYQTFSVNTGDVNEDDELAVKWNGEASGVDENHPITLFAVNAETGKWVNVGEADSEGNIDAAIPAKDYVKDGAVTLLVQSRTKGTIPVIKVAKAEKEIAEAQEAAAWDGTSRPDDYDFALAWETDTQYYTESFPYHYREMNQWIVDNAEDWKISYVLHTGDIVDDADMAGQWMIADEAMQILEDADMPYGVLGGNHDVYAGSERYGFYWQYFGEDRFADKDYYGGSYKNNLGHYDLITAGGQDLVIVYMSWDIYTEEIEWMNEVLEKYSDRKAILAFHRYANVSKASYEGSDSLLDYAGKIVQKEVVAKNPNVIAVLNGHYHGATLQTTGFDDDGDGVQDRQVYEICTDYQSDPEAGSQYIKFLYFDLDSDKIYVNSYSPYRNDYNYYDTEKKSSYDAGTLYLSQDIAEMDVNFDTTERTLVTNAMAVDVRTQNEIGTVNNATGKVTYQWAGLEGETSYSWYAKVTNSKKGKTFTDVKTFTTATAPTYKVVTSATAGGTISGDTEVKRGSDVTYTFTPDSGYKVLQVMVDGALVNIKGNTYTLENVKEDHTIEVTFAKEDSTYVPDAPEDPENPVDGSNSGTNGGTNNETNAGTNNGSISTVVGTKVTSGKVTYKVTANSAKSKTVTVSKVKTTATNVTIPSTVKINGVTYKVTSIAANAFAKNKKLKTVTIGKNVTSIGTKAFYKCTALKKVTVNSKKLTKIGTKAFYGDKKLASVTLKTTKLTSGKVGKSAFKGIKATCKFKVPSSKVKSYKKIFKAKGAGKKIKVTK